MAIRILLLILLIPMSAMGVIDSVKVNKVSVVPSKIDDNWMVSTPRNHLVCLTASGELIVTTKNDPNEYVIKYTSDTGTTWTDSLNETHAETNNLSNHHHISVNNDTIYITDIPRGGAGLIDTGYIWVVDATGALTEIRESLFEVETDNADRVYIGSAKRIPDSDSTIYIYRDQDLHASNISYVVSTDEFSTVGTAGFVANGGVDARVGMFYFNNSVSAQVYWRDSTLALYHWNRATQTWDTETNNPFQGRTSQRNYSVTSLGDSLLFAALEASQPDTLLYAWRHKDTATWHVDTLAIHSANTMGKVTLMAVEAAQTVFAFYSMDSVSLSYNVWYKYWHNGSWSSETQVIGDSINGYRISTPDRVPQAHGDVAYLYVNDATNDQMKLMVFDVFEGCENTVADTLVYGLPFTVTTAMNGTAGDPYVIALACDSGGAIHSQSNGFYFNQDVHDVKLSLGEDTIYWNELGGKDRYAIRMSNDVYNITIDSGIFIHNPPDSVLHIDTLLNATAIYAQGLDPHDWTFNHTKFTLKGRNGQMLYHSGVGSGLYNWYFNNVNFYDSVTSFTQRDLWVDFSMLAFGNLSENRNAAGFNYHLKMYQCSTFAAPWVNLYLHGDSIVAYIDSNYFYMDARNDLPNSGLQGSAEQCYHIGMRDNTTSHSTIRIAGNVFRTGTDSAGGDAIFCTAVGADTTQDSSIWIYQNDINVQKGFAGEYNTSTAVKLRQTAKNIRIEDNDIYSVADVNASTSHITQLLNGIRIEESAGAINVIIDNNRITTAWATDFTQNLSTYSACIELAGLDSTDASGLWIRNNRLRAGNLHYQFGNGNANPDYIEWATIEGDTLEWVTDSSYNQGCVQFYGQGSGNNILLDPVLIGNISTDSVAFSGGTPDATSEIFWKRTFSMTIHNQSGSPLSDVEVFYVNGYADTVGIDTTDVNGNATYPCLIYYENGAGVDTTNLEINDYKVFFTNGSVSDSLVAYTLDWDNGTVTDTLVTAAEAVINRLRKVYIRKGKI